MLPSAPLFGNLIDEKAKKYLWVDAATRSGVLGAVLAQKIIGDKNEKIIPTALDLDDPVHQIIFDKELTYTPAKLYTSLPIKLPKPLLVKTVPPNILPPEPLLGFTEEHVHESFFWSTVSILAFYGCQVPTTSALRSIAMKKLKSRILNNKLKGSTFNLDYEKYQDYMSKFGRGEVGMDPELYMVEALASGLHRPIIFIPS
jgi:hypothetical protein